MASDTTSTNHKDTTSVESNHVEVSPNAPSQDDETPEYPGPAQAAIIMGSLYIAVFLVALDRTITGVAIPQITNQFHSTDDIGWYGSVYMVTTCGFVCFFGRVYTLFSSKWIFLSGVIVFEIGSALCGAAPNSIALIVGRAISGVGAAAIFTGSIVIMVHTVPLQRRPLYTSLFGACFGVSSVAGPLLGGAFTGSKATWRWCFYINLPLGAITVAALVFFLHIPAQKQQLSVKDRLASLDPVGSVLLLSSITCLLLALQWGGSKYAWSEWRVIVLLVLFAVLTLLFIWLQYATQNTTASIPARIIRQRSVFVGAFYQFLAGAVLMTVCVYLPLWFQAIKGVSAVQSGIDTFPLLLSLVVSTIICGAIIQRVGYYTQFMILGSMLMSIAAGLFTTWDANTGHAKWIGHQFLLGIGIGSCLQQANLAVQTVLPTRDIAIGSSMIYLFQMIGASIFIAIAQNIFIDKFIQELGSVGGFDPTQVIMAGATALKDNVPKQLLPKVLDAYNDSLVKGPFLVILIAACLSIICALGMEWRSIKKGSKDAPMEDEESARDVDTEKGSEEAPAAAKE
jgi:EmrB/QacA subfamily drug resistance transporter